MIVASKLLETTRTELQVTDIPIRLIVRKQVKPGRMEDFMRFAETYSSKVKESEPATLAYEWFSEGTGTEVYLSEVYADSQSLLLHLTNLEAVRGQLIETSFTEDFLVLGDPDKQATEKLCSMGARIYRRQAGFAR